MPVLDAPQYLQLHAAVDLFTAIPFSVASQVKSSSIYWLDREVMSNSFKAIQKMTLGGSEEAQQRRILEILEEGWDMFLRVLDDGSVIIQAVAVRLLFQIRAHCVLIHWIRTLTAAHQLYSNTSLSCSSDQIHYLVHQTIYTLFPTRHHLTFLPSSHPLP